MQSPPGSSVQLVQYLLLISNFPCFTAMLAQDVADILRGKYRVSLFLGSGRWDGLAMTFLGISSYLLLAFDSRKCL